MRVHARIVSIDLAGDIRRVRLEAPAPFRFAAGQYLFIVHPSGRRIPFSVASAPHRLPTLEIDYKPAKDLLDSALVDELLARAGALVLDGPRGSVKLTTPTRSPLLVIAGGTGVSQARSMVSFLTTRAQRAPVTLVWSVARAADLYCEAELRAFEAHRWFVLHTVVDAGNDNAAVRWIETAHDRLPDDGRVILSGGPGFVAAVERALAARGIAQPRVRSDMFAYRA